MSRKILTTGRVLSSTNVVLVLQMCPIGTRYLYSVQIGCFFFKYGL